MPRPPCVNRPGGRYHRSMPASVIGTTVFGVVFWFASPVLVRAIGHVPRLRSRWWIVAGIAAVAVSWFLPSPILEEETATFMQHAVGGGLASVCVAFYIVSHVPDTTFVQRGLAALAVTSVLGVGNELLELGLDVVNGTRLTADAAWDLFANTVGAALSFLAIEAALGAVRQRRVS